MYEAIFHAIKLPLLVLDGGLRVAAANAAFLSLFQMPPEQVIGRPLFELGGRQWDAPELRQLLEGAVSEGQPIAGYQLSQTFRTIGERRLLLDADPLGGEASAGRILLTIADASEREATPRQAALLGEMHHRLKNILGNVHALATHTRRGSRNLSDFFEAFEGRLGALSRTQELLVRNPQQAVALEDIIRHELEAVGVDRASNITVEGPRAELSPRDAQAVAMTIHELTTNAVKYGALSRQGGRLEIGWTLRRRQGRSYLSLRWRERGVPIADTAPAGGFGSQVIEESLPHILGGTARLTFHRNGAACRLEFPLPA